MTVAPMTMQTQDQENAMRSKKEAETAARGLLESKVSLVGAIGQAIEADQKAAQAVVDAQQAKEEAEEDIRRGVQRQAEGVAGGIDVHPRDLHRVAHDADSQPTSNG